MQGDVTGLIDSTGSIVASYTYDPYGNILTSTGSIADKNPLRYRGYYYDEYTGFYYLISRYYDPNTGRFINADTVDYLGSNDSILSLNLFAYCLNNPINCLDNDGHSVLMAAIIGGAIAGAFISTISYLVSTNINGENYTFKNLIYSAVKGAIFGSVGATIGALIPKTAILCKCIASFVLGWLSGGISYIETDDVWSSVINGAVTFVGIFTGSLIDAYHCDLSCFANCFTNYSATLLSGTVPEIANVYLQTNFNSTKPNNNRSKSITYNNRLINYNRIKSFEIEVM